MVTSDPYDPTRLALPTNGRPTMALPAKRQPRHRAGDKFLRGPIPLAWLALAAKQPGKALAVALVLWFLAGVQKHKAVKWEPSTAELFGMSRHVAYRGQKALEKAA